MTMVMLLWGLSVVIPKLLGLGLCGPGGLSREESAFTSQPLRVGRWVLLSKYRPINHLAPETASVPIRTGQAVWGWPVGINAGPGPHPLLESRLKCY